MAGRRRGRGEGALEKLPSGKWRAIICRVVNGKRVRESKAFRTKAEAIEWRDERRKTGPASPLTLNEWVKTWLDLHRAEVAASTYETDRFVLNRHVLPALGAHRLRDLTPLTVGRWLATMKNDGISQSMRHMAGRSLRKLLNAAVRNGVISDTPIRGLKMPAPSKPKSHALSADQLKLVIDAAERLGLGALYRLHADAGVRPGELTGFQVGDFSDGAGTITVQRSVCRVTGELKATKTEKVNVIGLTPSTVAALRSHLAARAGAASDAPLFPSPGGGHWNYQEFRRCCFEPVLGASGVLFTSYTLRHTMASLLLQAGVNVKVVQERLGHYDISLTLRSYGHLLPGMQATATAALESILGNGGALQAHLEGKE